MTIEEILKWVGGGAISLATIVQLSPVRFNPWSWLAKTIGRALLGEMLGGINDRIDKLEEAFDKQQKTFEVKCASDDEDKAIEKRRLILQFGDDLRRGKKHSEEMFNQILDYITEYDAYCEAHPGFKNMKAAATEKLILHQWDHCVQNNDFL